MRNYRFLFLFDDYPLTPNGRGGASALCYGHLELLAYSGTKISLVALENVDHPRGFRDQSKHEPEIWANIVNLCETIEIVQYYSQKNSKAPARHFLKAIHNTTSFFYPQINDDFIKKFCHIIQLVQPDLIFAEHQFPALLAVSIYRNRQVPIIYGLHDWEWKLSKLRNPGVARSLSSRIKRLLRKKLEVALVQNVDGVISGSYTEGEEAKKYGAKLVDYFPTIYPEANIDLTGVTPTRIIHLGGMATTASRKGLERFLDVVWPTIKSETESDLWVVGSLEGASSVLLEKLSDARIQCHGFVKDLKSVLCAYDIHIIPWEYNTGIRTRIPLALSYSQVIVAMKPAADGLKELIHGVNCKLVDNLDDMAEIILELLSTRELRVSLGNEGRNTFLECYTREAQQSRFEHFLNQVRADKS